MSAPRRNHADEPPHHYRVACLNADSAVEELRSSTGGHPPLAGRDWRVEALHYDLGAPTASDEERDGAAHDHGSEELRALGDLKSRRHDEPATLRPGRGPEATDRLETRGQVCDRSTLRRCRRRGVIRRAVNGGVGGGRR